MSQREQDSKHVSPHLHVCDQPRGDAHRAEAHAVLPNTVRVHLQERKFTLKGFTHTGLKQILLQ